MTGRGTPHPPPREPWGRRPLPEKSNWRRALDVYVAGKSRGLTDGEKRKLAVYRLSGESPPRERGANRPAPTSFGVPVPEKLQFHRGASTWRRHLPGSAPRGSTASDDG